MKETIRHILSGSLFLGLLAGMLLGLNFLFRPKDNTEAAGFHYPWASGYLAEPVDTIDVLILGDSEVYADFIPLQIWQEQGITVYTCGTSDQKLYQTEEYLRTALETQSPKIVILETNILYRDYSRTDTIPQKLEELLPLLRYHDRWKRLGLRDLSPRVRYTGIQRDKGYHFYWEAQPADTRGYMEERGESAPFPVKNAPLVRKLLARCQEHGARLMLVSAPSTVNWSDARHDSVQTLARELGIPYLDMNLLPGEVPIDWRQDSYDGGDHMNYRGARKVSACLGQYLAETGLFEDKRADPDYAAWHQCLESFLREHPETEGTAGN